MKDIFKKIIKIRWGYAGCSRSLLQDSELIHVVDYEIPYALRYSVRDVRVRLIGAVEEYLLCRESCRECRIYLTRRYRVHAHPLGLSHRVYTLEAQSFAREKRCRLRAEILVHRIDICPAFCADHILVEYVQRCAVFSGELGRVQPSDCQMPL